MKKILLASLTFNLLGLAVACVLLYVYREDVTQYLIATYRIRHTITMLGDSHTERGKWNTWLHRLDVKRAGYPGLVTWQIKDYFLPSVYYNTKICFVLTGTNDALSPCYSLNETMEDYSQIADSLRNHQVLPVFQTVPYAYQDTAYNARIDSLNKALVSYCHSQRIDVLDLCQTTAKAHQLNPDYRQDKIHLNESGYQVWANLVHDYMAKKGL